jgi:hypothetical protein
VLRSYCSLNGVFLVVCVLQEMEDKLKRLAHKVSHHEDNIRFLKSQLNAVEEACIDLESKLLICSALQFSCSSFVPSRLCKFLFHKMLTYNIMWTNYDFK